MRRVFTAIILGFCMVALAACKIQNDTGEEVANGIPQFESLNEVMEGRPNIYLIVKILDSQYWQVIVNGVKHAADMCDCNVYYSGTYNETDWENQHKLIEQVLDLEADGLIIAPNDSIKLTSDLEEVKRHGIAVALVDTVVNEDVFDVCYMTDNFIAGQDAAKEMLLQLAECGHDDSDEVKVGILVGSSVSQTISERLAGFYQYWYKNAPNDWSIISDIMNCDGDIEYAKELTENIIKEHPDICGLYGTNNGPTRALCTTVMNGGYKDIVVVGFDFSDEMKAMIESEDYVASTMLQRQYDMGYHAVEALKTVIEGGKIDNVFEDTGVITVKRQVLDNDEVVKILKQN